MSHVSLGRLAVAYLLTLPLLVGGDLLWIGVVARGFYQDRLGHLLRSGVNWWAAGAFYLIFLAGVFAFAALPALDRGSALHALGAGALLGLVTYATYDLTNLATLRGWPLAVVAVDVAWGTAFVAAMSLAAYRILTWLV